MVDYFNRKKKKKKKKETLLERAEIPAECGMYLRGTGCSTQRQSPGGLDVGWYTEERRKLQPLFTRQPRKQPPQGVTGCHQARQYSDEKSAKIVFLFTVNWMWSKEDLMSCELQGFKQTNDNTELIFSDFYKPQNIITSSCFLGLWGHCCGCLG